MRKSVVEEWGDISKYCDLYQANNLGYSRVTLSKKGVHHTYYIHRLIAETFIPNPDNLPQINHKDENLNNNEVSNLKWCTVQYNNTYGSRNLKALLTNSIIQLNNSKSKEVIQLDLETTRIQAYGYKWRYK